ncbi:dihydrodipicolinate reductase C-terminal domain-containing protein [Rhodohalobacter sp. 8-1]|uniref:dihydrodipicolinate reductase C-terminal domain-containing protein n=1 Tax=Rhodohalobacter sp. 8-1 TaxID=3131972 RepID=UPI0030ECA2E7
MKISVIGTGKTGGSIAELLGEQAVSFNSSNKPTASKVAKTDAAIIFVPGEAAPEIIEIMIDAEVPAVWGTTGYGWSEDLPERVKAIQSKWVIGSNFSLGMNLVRKALNVLGEGSDMLDSPKFHIHETHHTDKKDAPSGTALSWEKWLNKEARISSSRIGDVKGIHELHIKTVNESIYLKHEAHDRKLFAEGAIWAAKKLLNDTEIIPGVYPFSELFDKAFSSQ